MANDQEVRYEHENLLDKFIRNERKAKSLALISILVFCVIATTVIAVAYQLKNSGTSVNKKVVVDETEPRDVVTDQVKKTVDEKKTDKKITDNSVTINYLKTRIRHLEDSLKIYIGLYTNKEGEVEKLNGLLNDCRSKQPDPDKPLPGPSEISVIIYTIRMPDSSLGKLKKILPGKNKDNYRFAITIQPVTKMNKPLIRYGSSENEGKAKYLASVLNNNNIFRNWNNLVVIPGDRAVMKADIEVWLGAVF